MLLDKEDHVVVEMERISREHHCQMAGHCDELCQTIQQQLTCLSELTEQCRQGCVTQMKAGSDQLLRDILASIKNV